MYLTMVNQLRGTEYKHSSLLKMDFFKYLKDNNFNNNFLYLHLEYQLLKNFVDNSQFKSKTDLMSYV